MAQQPDAVTGWWRRISLRAKVTGVTVVVLALGLLVAGLGTVPILRNALVNNIDAQLPALASSADRFFDITSDGEGGLVLTDRDNAPRAPDYFLAVYSAEGQMLARAGGAAGAVQPAFPETFNLQQAKLREDQVPIAFSSADGKTVFHGAVFVDEGPGAFYVQVVAMSLDEADRIVGTYFTVYISMALITMLVAALLIRGLVTLTFRRLGQVESTAMSIAAGDFSQRLTDLEPTTEVGRLNYAINTMLDRLDSSLAARERTVDQMRRFIGDASHELRTPLVSVRGYAELYRMGAIRGEEDTARAMERIEKEAIRMGVLVEDLLALARLDGEQQKIEIAPLDLRPIARDAALDVRAAAPGRPVTVIDLTAKAGLPPLDADEHAPRDPKPTAGPRGLAGATLARLRRKSKPSTAPVEQPVPVMDFSEAQDAPVRTPPIVLGEENRVRQVVTNLLGNARRFSHEEDPIEIVVDADRSSGMGGISIVDHGEGVPEPIRDRIFERFWRADTSRARETGGSGLGLAIVSSIMSSLNGSVGVTETPGGGATFTVRFPLAPARAIPEHLLEDTQPIERLDLSTYEG